MSEELIELIKSDEDMEGVQFVLRAMYEKPDSQPNGMCHYFCVKVEDALIVGTDGKRVHTFKYTGLYSPGVYRVLKRLKTHVVMIKELESDYKKPFPPYKKLLDYPLPDHEFSKHFPDSDMQITDGLTMVIRHLQSYETIQPGYLKALDDIFDCKIAKNSEFIFFENADKTAVIAKYNFEI